MRRVCAVCGGSLMRRFERVLDPYSSDAFAIDACADCGLGHTEPAPASVGPYYTPDYHGRRHGWTSDYCAFRRIRFVEQSVEPFPPRRLLDVGCGDGTFLQAAARRGWEVVGTELNPLWARSRGLEVHEGLDQALERGPFSVITLWHSLEHLTDPVGTLQALASHLAPDGVVLAAVPNAEGLPARLFGPRWFHLDVPRHLFHFSQRSLHRAMERAGLQVENRWHHEVEYDLLGLVQSSLNAVMGPANTLFRALTGRPVETSRLSLVSNFFLATALTPAAFSVAALSTLMRQGGTIVVAARPVRSSPSASA